MPGLLTIEEINMKKKAFHCGIELQSQNNDKKNWATPDKSKSKNNVLIVLCLYNTNVFYHSVVI